MSEVFEFDVDVTVRKRIHVSGPTDREVARQMLKQALSGGMPFGMFAKRGEDGHAIERVVSNDFDVSDPQE